MRKKVCKQCKIMVTGDKCPICNGNDFSTNFQGRIYIVDPVKSKVAQKLNIEAKGEYALKVR
ncbi:MAG: DNA-directed RNA polymerase subunit E'' [Candidatus Woesearchaeota archaeon]|nr:DNA-directed RNA polymerase subunit E'' [Candidatus Woesearchaeota archaeon]